MLIEYFFGSIKLIRDFTIERSRKMVLTKRFYLVSVLILVVLLGVLAIGDLDYSISYMIINKHSIWAEFFNMFGEFPALFGMLLAVVLLYGGRRRDVPWWNILSTVIGVVFILLFSYMVIFLPIRYVFEFDPNGIPMIWNVIILILSAALAIAAFYVAHKHGNKFVNFKKHAWFFIVLIVSEMLLVNIVKMIWARPRMRSMTDISEFKHWYEINGWQSEEELKSFPSGHTANGFVAIAYMIFVPYFKSIKMNYFIIGAVVWGTMVALSRVVLGAHFLSDVVVGSYITIFLFILWEKVFFRSLKK